MILPSLKNVNQTYDISMILVCSLDVRFQHVNETDGISMILMCSLDVQFQNVNNTYGISMILVCSSTLSLNLKMSQIGIRCSRTRKCSQRYEIDHFCQGFFQPFNFPKFFHTPVREHSVLHIQCPIYI